MNDKEAVSEENKHWSDMGRWDTDLHGVPPYELKPVVDRISAVLPTGKRHGSYVLDLGCGIGRLTHAMAMERREFMYVGADISRVNVSKANETQIWNTVFRRIDGRHLDWHKPLVGAYSVTVFQHIPYEAKVGYLKQVWDLLVPGSPFIFTVAIGEEKAFLNHQLTDDELLALIESVGAVAGSVLPDYDNDWTWVTLWKT